MIKVLVADSNELIRIGLKHTLEFNKSVKVVDECTSSRTLLEKLNDTKPDILLIDYTAPDFSIEDIYKSKENSHAKIVAITPDQMATTIVSALKGGVTSYIKKDCDLQEIRDAVVDTADNKKFFCGQVLETIRKEDIEVDKIHYEPLTCAPISLSEREQEIIAHIAEGFTNTQIAEKLFLSAHTITTHRKNIMSKLGVNNTAAIVMYAVKNRLVNPNKYLFS